MFQKHKWPTFSGIIVIILFIISIVSLGFLSENRIGVENKITGNMAKVAGMEIE